MGQAVQASRRVPRQPAAQESPRCAVGSPTAQDNLFSDHVPGTSNVPPAFDLSFLWVRKSPKGSTSETPVAFLFSFFIGWSQQRETSDFDVPFFIETPEFLPQNVVGEEASA